MLGVCLAAASSTLAAQTAARPPVAANWSFWLQNLANFTKVIEMLVFVFSGYQFWAGRRERKGADVAAAEQARIDSIYQAWQVINSAQGKGGSGGRVEALRDLLRNNVSLAGINLDGAWLEGVQLENATLTRGSLQSTNLTGANLSRANLEGADLRNAVLVTANLTDASLRGANLTGARLSAATLDGADLTEVIGWSEVTSISYASIDRLRHAPPGFLAFAREGGAGDGRTSSDDEADGDSYSKQFRAM
jgi:hypothetical protein